MRRTATILATFVATLCLLPALAAAAAPPTVGYSPPSPIRNKEATLRFSIDPEGLETSYEIEIAMAGRSLKSWEMPTLVPTGDEPVALEVKVPRYFEAGLIPGTGYHWRVTAWNDKGKTVGAEQFFTTTDGPRPIFTTSTASQTGPGRVSLTGSADPEGAPLTDCRFRWEDKANFTNVGFEKWAAVKMVRFGETAPCSQSPEEVGSGLEPVPVAGVATDIEPGEYVFRVEGENAFGEMASGRGVPFTVSADIETGTPPVLGPESPSFESSSPRLELPAPRKRCPRTHNRKALPNRASGKKRSHPKKPGRRNACRHR